MNRLGLALAALVLASGCGMQVVPAAEAPPVNGDPMPVAATAVAEPVSITIPALEVTDDVVPLGLCAKKDPPRCETGTGELELPPVTQVGWYRLAPKPGDQGRALIAGHVDYEKKPGAFKHLGSLKPGDRFTVRTADGADLTFAIYKVQTGLKKAKYEVVTAPLIFDPTTNREVALITCSGEVSGGQYSDNTVALGRLVT